MEVSLLTQAVFEGVPPYVKSAGISGYGHLNYFSVTKDRLSKYGRQLSIGNVTAADWPPIDKDYHEKLGYVACDTTDWQDSPINREGTLKEWLESYRESAQDD